MSKVNETTEHGIESNPSTISTQNTTLQERTAETPQLVDGVVDKQKGTIKGTPRAEGTSTGMKILVNYQQVPGRALSAAGSFTETLRSNAQAQDTLEFVEVYNGTKSKYNRHMGTVWFPNSGVYVSNGNNTNSPFFDTYTYTLAFKRGTTQVRKTPSWELYSSTLYGTPIGDESGSRRIRDNGYSGVAYSGLVKEMAGHVGDGSAVADGCSAKILLNIIINSYMHQDPVDEGPATMSGMWRRLASTAKFPHYNFFRVQGGTVNTDNPNAVVINGAWINMFQYSQFRTGEITPPAGWEQYNWDSDGPDGVAVVPIKTSEFGQGQLNASWTVAHMGGPAASFFRPMNFVGMGGPLATTASRAGLVIPGPTMKVLYVIVDEFSSNPINGIANYPGLQVEGDGAAAVGTQLTRVNNLQSAVFAALPLGPSIASAILGNTDPRSTLFNRWVDHYGDKDGYDQAMYVASDIYASWRPKVIKGENFNYQPYYSFQADQDDYIDSPNSAPTPTSAAHARLLVNPNECMWSAGGVKMVSWLLSPKPTHLVDDFSTDMKIMYSAGGLKPHFRVDKTVVEPIPLLAWRLRWNNLVLAAHYDYMAQSAGMPAIALYSPGNGFAATTLSFTTRFNAKYNSLTPTNARLSWGNNLAYDAAFLQDVPQAWAQAVVSRLPTVWFDVLTGEQISNETSEFGYGMGYINVVNPGITAYADRLGTSTSGVNMLTSDESARLKIRRSTAHGWAALTAPYITTLLNSGNQEFAHLPVDLGSNSVSYGIWASIYAINETVPTQANGYGLSIYPLTTGVVSFRMDLNWRRASIAIVNNRQWVSGRTNAAKLAIFSRTYVPDKHNQTVDDSSLGVDSFDSFSF